MDLVDLPKQMKCGVVWVIANSKIQTKTTGVLTLNHRIMHDTAR